MSEEKACGAESPAAEHREAAATTPFVVGFIGRSGVGKTTFAEQVVAELASRGFSVGAVA